MKINKLTMAHWRIWKWNLQQVFELCNLRTCSNSQH